MEIIVFSHQYMEISGMSTESRNILKQKKSELRQIKDRAKALRNERSMLKKRQIQLQDEIKYLKEKGPSA